MAGIDSKKALIRRLLTFVTGIAVVAGMLLFAPIHALLVVLNCIVHLFVLGLQLAASWLPRVTLPRNPTPRKEPFVSIHVPAYNEPPGLLVQTLESLSRLRWSNYEVLVIDNNTTDEALWRPVEEYCNMLGPKFRFFHKENLKGFKAGALNYVRRFMDPRAEYIFVVDADYLVKRNALRSGLARFTEPDVGLVQFPQDYRNVGAGNLGIALDFKHFFSGYMCMANALDCVPATGTLSLIRVEALRAVDGFDPEVITEDADLGFRLRLAGYRCLFVNEPVGQGVMPYDLESLKKQRWRWAFGNAQILKLNWKQIVFGPGLTWRQRLGFIAHLTAWFNFNLIPSLSLIVLAPLAAMERLSPTQYWIVQVSAFTLLSFLVLRCATIYSSLRHERHSLREIALACLTHAGLGWVFSASWLKCLFDHRAPFVRTNKFLGRMMPGPLRHTLAEISLGLFLLAACVLLAFTDFLLAPAAAIVMCGSRFLVFWVWRQTLQTWKLSRSLVGAEDDAVKTENASEAELLESPVVGAQAMSS